MRLGDLYFRTGSIQESLGYLETSWRLRPNNSITLHSLGVVYDNLGRKKEAAALYEASLKINGENPAVLVGFAQRTSVSNCEREP